MLGTDSKPVSFSNDTSFETYSYITLSATGCVIHAAEQLSVTQLYPRGRDPLIHSSSFTRVILLPSRRRFLCHPMSAPTPLSLLSLCQTDSIGEVYRHLGDLAACLGKSDIKQILNRVLVLELPR